MIPRRPFYLAVLAVSLVSAGPALAASDHYPYRGKAFTAMVTESCGQAGAGEFYRWMEAAYREHRQEKQPATMAAWMQALRRSLTSARGRARKTTVAHDACSRLHRLVKTMIPKFSLDRGFEFRNVVRYGERQCLLQSVLIAGILQKAGVDAGVVMVSRNEKGTDTNNGHVVTLVRLPDGTHSLVDASDPHPFARQQGLFVRMSGYRYVYPVFRGGGATISGYRPAAPGAKPLPPAGVRALDLSFIRSQFDFYRGERAPGGLLAAPATPEGLEASAGFLRRSVRRCPANPLTVFSLGRVYLRQGKKDEALSLVRQSQRIYTRAGWVPAGPREFLANVTSASR